MRSKRSIDDDDDDEDVERRRMEKTEGPRREKVNRFKARTSKDTERVGR